VDWTKIHPLLATCILIGRLGRDFRLISATREMIHTVLARTEVLRAEVGTVAFTRTYVSASNALRAEVAKIAPAVLHDFSTLSLSHFSLRNFPDVNAMHRIEYVFHD